MNTKLAPAVPPPARTGGFTMIELSIVMIIIGVIIAGGITIYTPSMRQAMKEKNEVIVQDAVKALIGYAGAAKKVPAAVSGIVRSPRDAQQFDLMYAYDANLDGSVSDKNVCNRNSAGFQVVLKQFVTGTDAGGNNTYTTIDNVAFVVWSRGHNGYDNITGFRTGNTFNIPVYASPATTDTTDDLVGWATLSELKAAAGCEGSPLKILADALVAGSASASAYGPVYMKADGGVSKKVDGITNAYAWCVESPALCNDADPALCAAGAGSLSALLSFQDAALNSVPVVDFNQCANKALWLESDKIRLEGSMPLAGQQGVYDFVVYLRDFVGNSTSRRLNLEIRQ
ncbi:MAG: prepilin-type N-terminal cleavage/methylation domain-containing protein [Magnetococcus sp. YQC-5]